MRGQRYVGGFRAGKVDDIDASFIGFVEQALANDEQVYAIVAYNCPDGFIERLRETGVEIEFDETLDRQAFLVEAAGGGVWTSPS